MQTLDLSTKTHIFTKRVQTLTIINLNISHIMLNNNSKIMEVMEADISQIFRLKDSQERDQDLLSEL
jgi:hypothetical protein